MIKNYFFLAFGHLKHRGLRSWLTMLGIFIGIAAVVSLITLGQGLERAVTGQFGALSLDTLTIQNKQTGFAPPGSAVVEKLNNHDLKIIEDTPGVEETVTRLIRVVNLEYNGVLRYSYVADLPDSKEGIKIFYEAVSDLEADKGRLLKLEDKGRIMVGKDLAREEVFGKRIDAGSRIKINNRTFEVIGILKPTSTFTINGAVMMPNEDMKEILQISDEFDLIVAKVDSPEKTGRVSEEIERRLRKDRDEDIGEESFSVETPLQALQSVNNILAVINAVVIGIASISLFVGGVGIANTMYTSVLERTRDIGIMKSIGAKNNAIMMIFLIESGLFGLIGGIVGAVMGVGGALMASSIANKALGISLLEARISYPLILGAVLFSFIIGVTFGIIPAVQASKLKVVDALRKR